ncbi:MAG: murein biosynthesis integral membrane protein MurJ [Nitrospinae bacterium]|nr:murein biosynthesis integral membrane protein MurJ [Nitrospinota bacterium]
MKTSEIPFLKTIFSIASITMVSRILGLVREQVRAHFLGTTIYSDAFTFAFAIPNLFRRLTAEGAMTNAYIPIFSEVKEKDFEKLWLFATNFFNILLFFTSLITVLGVAFSPALRFIILGENFSEEGVVATVELTQYMFVYILFISLAAFCQGILNSYGQFNKAAFTPVLFNLVFIGCAFLFSDRFSNPAYAFALGVVLGGIVQFLFLLPGIRKLGFRFKARLNLKEENSVRVMKLMVPGLLGVGVYQINIFVANLIAISLGEGAISSLSYSNRLIELVLGVFIVSISTVLLPKFSASAVSENYEKIKDDYLFSLRIITLMSFPAMVGLIYLKEPILNLLFVFQNGTFDAHSLEITAYALQFHAIGLYVIALTRVTQPLLFAFKDMKLPLYAGIVAMVINIVFCFALSPYLGNGGIALANTLSIAVQAVILIFAVKGKVGSLGLVKSYFPFIARIFLASVAMFCFLYYSASYFNLFELHEKIVLAPVLLGLIFAAILFFFLICALLRVEEMKLFKKLISR